MIKLLCQQLSKSTQLTDTMCTKYIREWIVLRPPLVRITIVPDIRNDIRIQIKVFISCQRNKKEVLKYDHLPAKEAEAIPWDRLLVDLIGPYKIRIYKAMITPHTKALTRVDLETGWFEIIQYKDKQADTIVDLVEKMWLCRYLRPKIITCYCGNEFLGHAFKNDLIKN